jgi:RIP metalloprotease RseP
MNLDFVAEMVASGWNVLRYPVAFLFVLTIVVFFHELGHFLVARWNGVRVLVFSVGFGRELFGFTDRYGTRWKLAAIPLGGYVKFFGDENAASVPDHAAAATMSDAERKVSFIHKKVGPRAAVVVAGPLANFILAILIFAGLFMVSGKQYTKPRIDFVQPASAAATAGFQKGDIIVAVDGRSIESFIDVQRIIATSPGRPLTFTIDRKGDRVSVTATPELREDTDRFRNVNRLGRLDIGGPVIRARVGSVQPGSAASTAGLEVDDLIEAIDGKPVETFEVVRNIVVESPGKPLSRAFGAATTMTVIATPAAQTVNSLMGAAGAPHARDYRIVRSRRRSPYLTMARSPRSASAFQIMERDRANHDVYRQRLCRTCQPTTGRPDHDRAGVGADGEREFCRLMQLAGVVGLNWLNLFPCPGWRSPSVLSDRGGGAPYRNGQEYGFGSDGWF